MDWAVWDNSYQFMIDKNPEYIKANLSEDTLNNLKINIMSFIDNKGNLVHGRGYDMANCQVKCDTSCKKTSIADFQPRHFRGLELIRNSVHKFHFVHQRKVSLLGVKFSEQSIGIFSLLPRCPRTVRVCKIHVNPQLFFYRFVA